MKKTISLTLTILTLLFSLCLKEAIYADESKKNIDTTLKVFLNNYFKTNTYIVFDDNYLFGNKKFTVAVEYTKDEVYIKRHRDGIRSLPVIKGVIIEKNVNEIVPHLYIEKQKVFDRLRNIILDLTPNIDLKLFTGFCGWRIEIHSSKQNVHSGGLGFGPVFITIDRHYRSVDFLTVFWDTEKNLFVEEKYDTLESRGLVPIDKKK